MLVHRLAIAATLVILLAAAGSAGAQCSAGDPIQKGCGAYSFEGCCEGQILLWCEGGWLCGSDCTLLPYCGWDAAQGFYNCDSAGNPAPGNNPSMQCPTVTDVDGDGYEAPADCDDTNPNVNPAAPENCANGIDDDCDGFVDQYDSDCAGGDDDVGDDDAGDDDDDVSDDDDDVSDDDDDDDTEEEEDETPNFGVVCGCRQDGANTATSLVGLGVLVMLGWLRRR